MKSILDLVEEAVNGTLNERIVVMKLSLILLNQTFVAVPTSVTVADFAAFYITSLVFVSFLDVLLIYRIHSRDTMVM